MNWNTTIIWDTPILKWASMNCIGFIQKVIDDKKLSSVKFAMPSFGWEMLSLP